MSPDRGRALADAEGSPWHLGIAVAAVVAVRVASVWHRQALMSPLDEAAPLAIARTLAGDTPFVLSGLRFDVGWGTLLTPVYWVVNDPVVVLRAIQFVNVGLAVGLLLVVRGVLLELFDVTPNLATWAAFVGVSMPGAVMQTQYVGSEVLISVGFAGFLLVGLRLLRAPTPLAAAGLAVLAVGLYHVHARLTGLIAVAAIVLVVELVRGSGPRIGLGAALVLLLAGVVVATGQTERLQALVWSARSQPTERMGELVDRLGSSGQVVLSTLGMVWQQLVVTFGLAGIGAWAVARGVLWGTSPGPGRAEFDQDRAAGRRAWGFLLASAAAAMAPAAVFMASRPFAPHMVYGRYWDALVVPAVAVAVVVVVRSRPRRSASVWAGAAIGTLGVGAVLALVRQDDIDAAIRTSGVPGARRIAGLLTYVGQGDPIDVWSITLVAVAVVVIAIVAVAIATVAGAGSRWRELVVVAMALMALGATGSARANHAQWQNPSMRWHVGGAQLPVDLVVDGQAIAFQMQASSWQEVRPIVVHALYQFTVPDVALVGAFGARVRSYEWIVADVTDPHLTGVDAVVVYQYADGQGLALWHNRAPRRGR